MTTRTRTTKKATATTTPEYNAFSGVETYKYAVLTSAYYTAAYDMDLNRDPQTRAAEPFTFKGIDNNIFTGSNTLVNLFMQVNKVLDLIEESVREAEKNDIFRMFDIYVGRAYGHNIIDGSYKYWIATGKNKPRMEKGREIAGSATNPQLLAAACEFAEKYDKVRNNVNFLILQNNKENMNSMGSMVVQKFTAERLFAEERSQEIKAAKEAYSQNYLSNKSFDAAEANRRRKAAEMQQVTA